VKASPPDVVPAASEAARRGAATLTEGLDRLDRERVSSLRGDVRYFRDLENSQASGLDLDLGHVDYWRAVGGLTL